MREHSHTDDPARVERGRRIREARKAKGLSQTQLATLCNSERGVVWEWERGNNDPHLETFALICRVLDLDANEMLGLPMNGANE